MTSSENSEKKILDAAREEFIKTGFKGARMQNIADRAGVNKALLHYYFRSKSKLYESSLLDVLLTFWNALEAELERHPEITDLNSTIRLMVQTHIKVLSSNPCFPRMMLREVADGGELIPMLVKKIISHHGNISQRITALLQNRTSAYYKNPAKTAHLFLNIMGMSIVTFLIQPFADPLSGIFRVSLKLDEQFINERIESIVSMINNGAFSKEAE